MDIKLDLGGSGVGNGAFIRIDADTATIHVIGIESADDIVKIFKAARQAGATNGTLYTGKVTSETDLKRYQELARNGGTRFGGIVTQLRDDEFRLDFDDLPKYE